MHTTARSNAYLALLLAIFFVLYCSNPEGAFEQTFFLNECLCLAGLCVVMANPKAALHTPLSSWVLALFGILLLHSVASIVFYHSQPDFWPVFTRHFQVVYSFLAIGAGFFLFKHRQLLLASKHLQVRVALATVALLGFGLLYYDAYRTSHLQFTPLHRFSLVALLPLLFVGQRRAAGLLIAGSMLLYGILFNSSTNLLAALSLLVLAAMPNARALLLVVSTGMLLVVGVFVWHLDTLPLYTRGVVQVYNHSPLLQLDHNTGYRFVLWYQALTQNFPQNLLGIGLGTPFLQVYPIDTAHIPNNYHLSTSLAIPHNTFVWVYMRLGLAGLFAFVGIAVVVLRDFFTHRHYYITQGLAPVFYAFWLVLVMGFFNSTIETRTTAALYWVPLGMVAAAMQHRQHSTAQTAIIP